MTAQHIDDAGAPSRALLARVGEALHGPWWQEELARSVGVSGRSVRYWVAGERPIPVGIWPELRMLLLARKNDIQALAEELVRQARG